MNEGGANAVKVVMFTPHYLEFVVSAILKDDMHGYFNNKRCDG
jgi:hypothetical protein